MQTSKTQSNKTQLRETQLGKIQTNEIQINTSSYSVEPWNSTFDSEVVWISNHTCD